MKRNFKNHLKRGLKKIYFFAIIVHIPCEKKKYSWYLSVLLNIIIFQTIIFSSCLFSKGLKTPIHTGLKNKYDPLINNIARKYDVEPALVHSIIFAESNYNTQAVSPKGAVGMMQLMPQTAEEYGVKNAFDPHENIEGGVKYLKDLISLYGRKTDLVLAAYNAGQETIKKYGGVPPYPETINYIQKVKISYPKSIISARTIIYKFYDSSGKLILTNDPNLYLYSAKLEK